jgi:hypothetical protein
VRGNINSWFKCYLTDWKQFVEINQRGHINSKQHKYNSSCKVLKCGVPQGSVLVPLLFLIYKKWPSFKCRGWTVGFICRWY